MQLECRDALPGPIWSRLSSSATQRKRLHAIVHTCDNGGVHGEQWFWPLPSVITQDDATLGPFMDAFLHETGHVVFDQLKVPVLGREEDAADLFSAYIMLQLGKEDVRRLILGNAYQYKEDVVNPQVPPYEIRRRARDSGAALF